ncbi:hypothetical protein [Pseudomonas syringae]|uniref:hypothetical protein n=1 Tax=Pseudomonas syringae TaxID=317 RepID=UPI001F34B326|nr:hypothetical protein [Pseudomonas syringae]MCF5371912.1 hypothetical protein [Pseudomonas syringae]MCF5382488.1 hypothetical protein [Pseudomonas syringae]MCF5419375.1 hypothetical protein [Pseudomonas syringae]MCF5451922.1 hypothetical protein [Pseudomonas syringae]MCF5460273.1 hypothetical protein [Pseudomonas syringae]
MSLYVSFVAHDIKTVKAQGARVASAWAEGQGIDVSVKAIKRTCDIKGGKQSGFVVLESLFETYLCFYSFRNDILNVTHERFLSPSLVEYLECPLRFFSLARSENALWRECVGIYAAALKDLPADRLAGNVTLFLKLQYEVRQYGEPFFVLQRQDGDWFGIDCYGERKILALAISDIYAHCPTLIDVTSQRAVDTSNLAADCVNTGVLIFKQTRNHAVLLGRPKTRAEIVKDQFFVMPSNPFDLYGDCMWA